jgi:hypothetical protein
MRLLANGANYSIKGQKKSNMGGKQLQRKKLPRTEIGLEKEKYYAVF